MIILQQYSTTKQINLVRYLIDFYRKHHIIKLCQFRLVCKIFKEHSHSMAILFMMHSMKYQMRLIVILILLYILMKTGNPIEVFVFLTLKVIAMSVEQGVNLEIFAKNVAAQILQMVLVKILVFLYPQKILPTKLVLKQTRILLRTVLNWKAATI